MEDFLTAREASELLGVSRSMLYKHVDAGRLTVYKSDANNKLSYFKKDEVNNLIAKKVNPSFTPVSKAKSDQAEL
jgi:excisionase family DNA binding protein